MDLDDLQMFADVCRAGSFAAVAKARELAPSSVSRSIANLEDELGVRLLHRTTRKLSPTEAGAAYLARIAPLIEELGAAQLEAKDLSTGPSGRLRVTASTSYGQIVLAPLIGRFRAAYPGVLLDLVLTDNRLDLVENRIDIALRHGALPDSALISKKLHSVCYLPVASPNYLENAPTLKGPADLDQHSLLTFPFEGFSKSWRFIRKGRTCDVAVSPDLTVTNAAALKALTIEGLGIALLADWTVADALDRGHLVHVLSDWTASGAEPDPAIWIVYPSRAFLPAKTRSFIDFLDNELG